MPAPPRPPRRPAVTLDVLPAQRGDCLWLEFSTRRGVRRVLVDGGTPATAGLLRARLNALPVKDRRFELLVVSHIDSDHIGGVIGLMARPPAGLSVGDVWFNGLRHLGPAPRSVGQGEWLADILGTRPDQPWNHAFGGGPVTSGRVGQSRAVTFDWGLTLTVLSPTRSRLARLRPAWQEALADARAGRPVPVEPQPALRQAAPTVEQLAARRSDPDRALPNGTSIALLAEYRDVALLLGADAFAEVLGPSVAALARRRGHDRLAVDAFKLPHHGSEANVMTSLLDAVDCRRWIFSTDGTRFDHPDDAAVARTILDGRRRSVLYFNYRNRHTRRWWARPDVQERYGFTARWPEDRRGGVRLTFR
ncbi:MAG TPA: MBL fold metallo-hydrolase [Acidimicrobiales bacterium]|nr:MBL fold metallo-hydrolase [Acidimicrobiales bacterium]